ncbi:MAG: cell division protein FtsA [Rikenellaceae bacterium]
MESKEYIVAVDLGDSNIVVAVGSAAEGDRINIDHILSRPSEGVSAGQIVNIDQAIKSIKGALDELRETTGLEVKEVYAGISGEFIYCTSHTDHVFVPDHKNGVTQQVVEALFERMSNVMVSEDRYIMERIPQRYVINDTTEVDNPVGVFGSPLSSTFNFISSDNVPLRRLDMALRRLDITPRRTFSNAVVVGDAVLSPDEKEEGVVVVDLGGELTDVAFYYHNVVRYISTIPLGAKSFNNDIRTLMIPERHIEPLKLKYGYALSKNAPKDLSVIIKGRSKHDQREIAVYNLAAVIEARARDIAELVGKEIADSGFSDKIPYGIVLTGGSAQLRGLGELFSEATGLEVRVAEAEDVISPQTRTKITSSSDSTVVGLLLHGLRYGACEVIIGEPTAPPAPQRSPYTQSEAPKHTPPPTPPTPHTEDAATNGVTPPVSVPQEPLPPAAPRSVSNTTKIENEPVKAPQVVVNDQITPTPARHVVPQVVVTPPAAPVVKPEETKVVEQPKPIVEESPTPSAQSSKEQATVEMDQPKPKRRVLKILSSLADGATTFVKSVNNRFDVDEDEEEI